MGQCLVYLDLPITPEEGDVLRRTFCDDKGFSYLAFLERVERSEGGVATTPGGGEQRKEV